MSITSIFAEQIIRALGGRCFAERNVPTAVPGSAANFLPRRAPYVYSILLAMLFYARLGRPVASYSSFVPRSRTYMLHIIAGPRTKESN